MGCLVLPCSWLCFWAFYHGLCKTWEGQLSLSLWSYCFTFWVMRGKLLLYSACMTEVWHCIIDVVLVGACEVSRFEVVLKAFLSCSSNLPFSECWLSAGALSHPLYYRINGKMISSELVRWGVNLKKLGKVCLAFVALIGVQSHSFL